MRYFMFWLRFLLLLSVFNIQATLSVPVSNSSRHLCHHQEGTALLNFIRDFVIDSSDPSYDDQCPFNQTGYPNIRSWSNNTDCCSWDGIFCDSLSGHVIQLDLSCGRIRGIIDSNSSLFQLQRLQSLNLAFNMFSGELPSLVNTSKLSGLTSLDLRTNMFSGKISSWVWNTATSIDLSDNQFSGELPSFFNTSKLSKLTDIDLSFNMLSGNIPPWFFTLPSLLSLDLSDNKFCGQLVIEYVNPKQSLQGLDLSNNMVHGSIPASISRFQSLFYLLLHSNKFNGTVDLSMFYKLQNLSDLTLSDNRLSLFFSDDTHILPSQIQALGLSSCNLGNFPDFLIDQDQLKVLELSNNKIHGQVPRWLLEKKLQSLDLSYNYLTGGLDHIPWDDLLSIDLRDNMFKGPLPQLPEAINSYLVSNNGFSGEIPPTVCNLTDPIFLDLSNNSLTGQIPRCLGNLSDGLTVLNLRSNKFQGTLPPDFTRCENLKNMNTNGNQLDGPIPPSLSRCSSLIVLDLGSNKLSGTFPHWLGALTKLEVLVLRSNRLEGLLTESDAHSPFPKLRILDIASNKFFGNLPRQLMNSSKALMTMDKQDEVQYMSQRFHNFREYPYMDSVALTFKGSARDLDKVLSSLTVIDVSDNMFKGDIPDTIGYLVSIRWLNLSYNYFSGTIPSSLGNLTVLESFDISSNELDGPIPKGLVSLTSLEFFNASRNQLVGPIPIGKQFNTFTNDSYLENAGLCGTPLSKKCGDDSDAATDSPAAEYHDLKDISIWEMVLVGYGCGMILGLVIGCLVLFVRTPFCLSVLICRVEFIMEQYSKRRWRRRLA